MSEMPVMHGSRGDLDSVYAVSKDALESARQQTNQFLALATGILALTITFSGNFVGSGSGGARLYLLTAWLLFLMSVFAGLWTHMALTGLAAQGQRRFEDHLGVSLIAPSRSLELPHILGRNVRLPAFIQVTTFLFGLVATVLFGVAASRASDRLGADNDAFETSLAVGLLDYTVHQLESEGLGVSDSSRVLLGQAMATAADRAARERGLHPSPAAAAFAAADSAVRSMVDQNRPGDSILTPSEFSNAFLGLCPIWPIC